MYVLFCAYKKDTKPSNITWEDVQSATKVKGFLDVSADILDLDNLTQN